MQSLGVRSYHAQITFLEVPHYCCEVILLAHGGSLLLSV